VLDRVLFDAFPDSSARKAGAFLYKQIKTVIILKKNHRIDD
jgi:ATP-dependent exoDNAse (exonuclease V) alpha subunit